MRQKWVEPNKMKQMLRLSLRKLQPNNFNLNTFNYIAIPSFVLCDDILLLCNNFKVQANSSFHCIRVDSFGTRLSVLIQQEKYSVDLRRATNVLLHSMLINLYVCFGGDLLKLVKVFCNFLHACISSFRLCECAN